MNKKNDEFIDLELNDCIVDFRNQYKEEYEIITECVQLFRLFEEKMENKEATPQTTYVLAAVMQLNKLYQSAIILLERGLKEPAYIICRTILELTFNIISTIKDEEFVEYLNEKQDIENQGFLKYVIDKELFDIIPRDKLDELVTNIDKNVIKTNKEKTKMINIVNENNLEREYSLYKMLCDYTHASNFVIGSTITMENNKCTINGNFQIEDFKFSVAFLISISIIVFTFLYADYLKEEQLKKEYEKFVSAFERVFKDILIK